MISKLGFAVATSIYGLALKAFWKRALQILRKREKKHTPKYSERKQINMLRYQCRMLEGALVVHLYDVFEGEN